MRKILLLLVCAGCWSGQTAPHEQAQSRSRDNYTLLLNLGLYEQCQRSLARLLLAFNLAGHHRDSTTQDLNSQHARLPLTICQSYKGTLVQSRHCSPMLCPDNLQLRWANKILEKAPSMVKKYQNLKEEDAAALRQLPTLASQLTNAANYFNSSEREVLSMALEVAFLAHHGQIRKSGEPFLIHPIAVAQDLAARHMDVESVIAGVLHDTVEDTELSLDEIHAMFGPTVRAIVLGETKISKLPDKRNTAINLTEGASREEENVENLRSMFIAMTEDYRIVQVKLADRLHNMKTLQHMSRTKQLTISRETLEIFVPLAHRLGMWDYKETLADLSFQYLYPKEYQDTKSYIDLVDSSSNNAINMMKQDLEEVLANRLDHIDRCRKSVYSTWKKTQKHKIRLAQIRDILALRVVLKSRDPGGCYQVLSMVHSRWIPLSGTFKDYIAKPKPNNYKSLHTTVLMDNHQPIEIQIRTAEMHEVAEKGAAANWKRDDENDKNVPWLKVQTEHEHLDAVEYLQLVQQELQSTTVQVFTGDGQVLSLKSGSTAAVAAKQLNMSAGWIVKYDCYVNDELVWPEFLLTNGDIITFKRVESKSSKPSKALGVAAKWKRCPQCMPLDGEKLIAAIPAVKMQPNVLHRADCNCRLLQQQVAVQGYTLSEGRMPGTSPLPSALQSLHDDRGFDCKIIVFCRDRRGILIEITTIVMELVTDMTGIHSEMRAVGEQAALQYTVHVENVTQLNALIEAVERHEEVERVLRDNIEGLMDESPLDFWQYGFPQDTSLDKDNI